MKKNVNKKILPYIFLLPSIILIGIIVIYPLISGIKDSFYNINLMLPAPEEFIGFDNYIELIQDGQFIDSFYRSFLWTISILFATMIGGFITALLLNQDIKFRRFFRTLILIPWIMPTTIGAITWRWIYAEQYGLLNYVLFRLNIIDNYQPWLSSSTLAFWAVTLVAIWRSLPFVTIVLLAALQAIPVNLYDAAKVDGANAFQLLLHVIIPHLKKIVLIVALLTSIWNFNQFEIIHVITRGGPGAATHTMPIFTYRLFMQTFRISYASSAATLMLVLMLILSYFYVKKLVLE